MEILFLTAIVVAYFWAKSERKYRRRRPPTYRQIPKTRRVSPKVRLVENRRPFQANTAQPADPGYTLRGRAYVVDGDTVVIQKTQIRLYGIDAPEMNHPYGNKAKWALVNMCKGQIIRADVTDTDTYGRTVARCYLGDGRDLSAEMVKLGLAIDWPKFSSGKYSSMEVPGVRKKLWLADLTF